MENTFLSHTSATRYIESRQQQEFEAHLCSSVDVLDEIGAYCKFLFGLLTQVLNNISESELHNDNHLKHSDVFLSEVKHVTVTFDFTCTKSLLQSIYGEEYRDEYFYNALMNVLDELELCHEYCFINNSPLWIDQLSNYLQKQTALICKDGVWNSTKAIRFVSYKMSYIYQKEYSVSANVLEQASLDFNVLPKDILKGSHMLHDMANVETILEEYNPSATSIDKIEKYVELSGFVDIPRHLYYLAELCKKADRWDLWTNLWDKLYHPVLQHSLLWSCKPLSLIEDRLRAALLKSKYVRSSAFLYFHHWLKCWREVFENLETYAEKNGWQAHKLQEAGIDVKAEMEMESLKNTFPNECNSLFTFLEGIVMPAEIVNIVSNIHSLADIQESTTQRVYEFTRITLIDEMCKRYQNKKFNISGQTFAQLLILSQMATASETHDANYLKSLWDAVESIIYTEKFNWNQTITAPQQHNMYLVAQLFIATHPYHQNVVAEYIDKHKVHYEGWGVKDISHRSDDCRSECYMLSVFLMSLFTEGFYPEEASKSHQLLSIVNHAILQDKSCHDTVLCSAYLRAVLLLAKCIAVKLPLSNAEVDKLMIEQIDNFVDLSEILINSSSSLSDDNKKNFKSRYDSEWEIEKQFLLSHPQRRNLEAIERGVEKILNSKFYF